MFKITVITNTIAPETIVPKTAATIILTKKTYWPKDQIKKLTQAIIQIKAKNPFATSLS